MSFLDDLAKAGLRAGENLANSAILGPDGAAALQRQQAIDEWAGINGSGPVDRLSALQEARARSGGLTEGQNFMAGYMGQWAWFIGVAVLVFAAFKFARR